MGFFEKFISPCRVGCCDDCYKHRPVRHPDIPGHGNGVVLLVVLGAS